MDAHETDAAASAADFRHQDHVIFAVLAIPIFAVTFFIIGLVVTLGPR